MKKRGFFFVALVLSAANLVFAADQNYTDLGTAQTLEVTENKLSEAQVNTGSYVTVITREQIDAYKPESTYALLNKIGGVTNFVAGPVGAMSTPRLMGGSVYESQIYIDGSPVTNVYSTLDMSTIPVSTIDHVELIKTGSGNLGNTAAMAGIINIVTKKAKAGDKTKFTLAVENGSYLPREYKDTDGDDERNWEGLIDTQKIDFTYNDSFDDINVMANVGGIFAKNSFTYEDSNLDETYRNEDNDAQDVHSLVNVNGLVGNVRFTSNNMVSYQNYNMPYDSWQKTFTFNSFNSAKWKAFNFYFDERYNYIKYEAGSYKDEHKSNRVRLGTDYTFLLNEDYSLTVGGDLMFDTYRDPESVADDDDNRVTPKAFVSGSFYFVDGKLGLYPMASISYVSDIERVSPAASLGTVYQLTDDLSLSANVAYSEVVPTFDMTANNEDMKTEQGFNESIGLQYNYNKLLTYKASVFAKQLKERICWAPNPLPVDPYNWSAMNKGDAAFFGTEQYVAVTPLDDSKQSLTIWGDYFLNKGYLLKDEYGNKYDLSDKKDIQYNRTHLLKFGADYTYDMWKVTFDVAWNSSPEDSDLDSYWLANVVVSADVMENLNVYAAIDNLFDTDYSSQANTPMPGMKIRFGGTWKF